jgi:F-type H+-transporting ATPase subunit b
MPQLDFSFYFSQISWLLVSFFTFFCLVKFLILPKLTKILDSRTKAIQDNIDFANKTLKKAQDLEQKNKSMLQKVQEEVSANIADAIKKYSDKNEQRLNTTIKNCNEELQKKNLSIKQEIFSMEKEIQENIASITVQILQKYYNMASIDENQIKDICKKNFKSVN